MSKFDKEKARAWVAGPDMGTHKACKYLLAACDHIDALEARIAKLEAVRDAARAILPCDSENGYWRLKEALAACDDGEGA